MSDHTRDTASSTTGAARSAFTPTPTTISSPTTSESTATPITGPSPSNSLLPPGERVVLAQGGTAMTSSINAASTRPDAPNFDMSDQDRKPPQRAQENAPDSDTTPSRNIKGEVSCVTEGAAERREHAASDGKSNGSGAVITSIEADEHRQMPSQYPTGPPISPYADSIPGVWRGVPGSFIRQPMPGEFDPANMFNSPPYPAIPPIHTGLNAFSNVNQRPPDPELLPPFQPSGHDLGEPEAINTLAYARIDFPDAVYYLNTLTIELGRDRSLIWYYNYLRSLNYQREESQRSHAAILENLRQQREMQIESGEWDEEGGDQAAHEAEIEDLNQRYAEDLAYSEVREASFEGVAPGTLEGGCNTRTIGSNPPPPDIENARQMRKLKLHPPYAHWEDYWKIHDQHVRIYFHEASLEWRVKNIGKSNAITVEYAASSEELLEGGPGIDEEKGTITHLILPKEDAVLFTKTSIRVAGIDIVFNLPDSNLIDAEDDVRENFTDTRGKSMSLRFEETHHGGSTPGADSDDEEPTPTFNDHAVADISPLQPIQSVEDDNEEFDSDSNSSSGDDEEPDDPVAEGMAVLADMEKKENSSHDPPKPEPGAVPFKKRGPGRPPKDGIMSKREKNEKRKEALKAQQEPEHMKKGSPQGAAPGKNKVGRPRKHPLPENQLEKTPKRKYTKRKPKEPKEPKDPDAKDGSDSDDENPSNDKKEKDPPRSPRSPSPWAGRDESSMTAEQLIKPSSNYVMLIFEVLEESETKRLALPKIYRAIQRKYPYFKFKVTTTGWQSSVRHNLSQHAAFEKVERDGKGWKWGIVAGATIDKEKKRAKTPPPPQGVQGHMLAIYPAAPGQHYPQQMMQGHPGAIGYYPGQYVPPGQQPYQSRFPPPQGHYQRPWPPQVMPIAPVKFGAQATSSYSSPYASAAPPAASSQAQPQQAPQPASQSHHGPPRSMPQSIGPHSRPQPPPPATAPKHSEELLNAVSVWRVRMLEGLKDKAPDAEGKIARAVAYALGEATDVPGQTLDSMENGLRKGAVDFIKRFAPTPVHTPAPSQQPQGQQQLPSGTASYNGTQTSTANQQPLGANRSVLPGNSMANAQPPRANGYAAPGPNMVPQQPTGASGSATPNSTNAAAARMAPAPTNSQIPRPSISRPPMPTPPMQISSDASAILPPKPAAVASPTLNGANASVSFTKQESPMTNNGTQQVPTIRNVGALPATLPAGPVGRPQLPNVASESLVQGAGGAASVETKAAGNQVVQTSGLVADNTGQEGKSSDWKSSDCGGSEMKSMPEVVGDEPPQKQVKLEAPKTELSNSDVCEMEGVEKTS